MPWPADLGAGLVSPVILAGAESLRVGAGSRLAKPSRSDARQGGLDAVPASWTIRSEEDGSAALVGLTVSVIDLWERPAAARPCRAGVPTQSPAAGAPAVPRSGAALIQNGSIQQRGGASSRQSMNRFDELRTAGLFVPKLSRRIDCQRRIMPGLGAIVRQRPLVSTAGTGDRYSLGYSALGGLRLGHLDANYRRVPGRDELGR